MVLIIEIRFEGDTRPPVGAPIYVEVRDTSLIDAPSKTMASVTGEVQGRLGSWLGTVEIDVPKIPDQNTVWAHIDVDRDKRVSRGDFVTTTSYPIRFGMSTGLTIWVRMV